jgi:hypothetical protein
LAAALLGAAALLAVSWAVANPVLLDTALILVLSSGVLVGVILALTGRAQPPQIHEEAPNPLATEEVETAAHKPILPEASQVLRRFADAGARIGDEPDISNLTPAFQTAGEYRLVNWSELERGRPHALQVGSTAFTGDRFKH